MTKIRSHLLGAISVAVMFGVTGCQGSGADGTGTSALTDSNDVRPDRTTMPEEPEGPRPRPGDEDPWPSPPEPCDELFEQIGQCHEIHGSICEAIHNDLAQCHEDQFAACDALVQTFFECEARGGNCEPLRLQADACFENSEVACAGIARAADECFEPCFELERRVEIECNGGNDCDRPYEADACGLLHEALGACYLDRPPELCITIEAALVTICAEHGGPGYPPEPRDHGRPDGRDPNDPTDPDDCEDEPGGPFPGGCEETPRPPPGE